MPPDTVHEDGLNVPPALLSDKRTLPDGVFDGFCASSTVTISVTDAPALAVGELGEIETDVESGPVETAVELLLVKMSPLSARARGIWPDKASGAAANATKSMGASARFLSINRIPQILTMPLETKY